MLCVIIHSNNCALGLKSQFAIITCSHLKPVLWYTLNGTNYINAPVGTACACSVAWWGGGGTRGGGGRGTRGGGGARVVGGAGARVVGGAGAYGGERRASKRER